MSEEAKKSIAGPLTVRPNTDERKPSPLPAVPLKKVIIKSADMIPDMQKEAVDIAVAAFEKYNVEKDVAEQVKKEFDKRHGPTWHCIVGRNFDACFVYEIMFDKMAGSGQPRQQVENETHAIETTDTSARKTEY